MFDYPVTLTPDDGTVPVTFADVPRVLTRLRAQRGRWGGLWMGRVAQREVIGKAVHSPAADRLNPSSSDSGGVQPNKRRVFSISTCKDPHRRWATSGLPFNVGQVSEA